MLARNKKEAILQSPLFKGVCTCLIEEVLSSAKKIKKSKDEFVFMKGDKADKVIFVLSGRIKKYYLNGEGEENIIKVYREEELLGLSAIFKSPAIRGSNCQAIETSYLLVIPDVSVRSGMSASVKMRDNVLEILAGRIEDANVNHFLVQKSSAKCRVASYIMSLHFSSSNECNSCKGNCIDLSPIALSAQEAGLTRETFTRILRELKNSGYIDIHRGKLKVNDDEALKKIATIMD